VCRVLTRRFHYETRGNGEMVNLTPQVAREVDASGLLEGSVLVYTPHTTAAVVVTEWEPGLLEDFPAFWERLAPRDFPYRHNRADDNGHAHLRASSLGPSVVVPFSRGRLLLGTWQQIALVDFDTRPRRREVVVQVSGVAE